VARPSPHEVTRLLQAWSGGDRAALDRLIPMVHDELHRLAHRYMKRERAGHILQTTALVNEAYLQLIDRRQGKVAGPDSLLRHRCQADAADPGSQCALARCEKAGGQNPPGIA